MYVGNWIISDISSLKNAQYYILNINEKQFLFMHYLYLSIMSSLSLNESFMVIDNNWVLLIPRDNSLHENYQYHNQKKTFGPYTSGMANI